MRLIVARCSVEEEPGLMVVREVRGVPGSNPLTMWVATDSNATVRGIDLGEMGPAPEQAHLLDFAIPQGDVRRRARDVHRPCYLTSTERVIPPPTCLQVDTESAATGRKLTLVEDRDAGPRGFRTRALVKNDGGEAPPSLHDRGSKGGAAMGRRAAGRDARRARAAHRR